MAFNEFHQYLIAYDIADPRRLGRLHRYMKQSAIPLQYSVFTAWLNHSRMQTLIADIEGIIHPKQDDVRIYPLTKNAKIEILGYGWMPEGIYLIAKGKDVTMHPDGLPEKVDKDVS